MVTYGALHMTEFIIIFDEKHNNKIRDKLNYIKHSNIAKKSYFALTPKIQTTNTDKTDY